MAFRTQKISQMTPKGADLEATDLIEVSTIESGSYVTRSITGQELIDAIPLPPTGLTVGTTPISSGTIGRVLFQGTGNVLQQSSSLFWDSTNNRLGIGTSSPTRALEIVGNINDVYYASVKNANSGTNAFSGFIIENDVSSAAFQLTSTGNTIPSVTANQARFRTSSGISNGILFTTGTSAPVLFATNDTERLRIHGSTGNIGINTTTDAGFRLDVNGTARVQNTLTVTKGASNFFTFDAGANGSDLAIRFFKSGQIDVSLSSRNQVNIGGQQIFDGLGVNGGFVATRLAVTSGVIAIQNTGGDALCHLASPNGFSTYVQFRENGVSERGLLGFQNGTSYLQIRTNGATNMSNGTFSTAFFSTGNVGINTTTDAGFRLDVNGTARVQSTLTLGGEIFGVTNTYFNGPSLNTGTLWLRFNAVNSNGNFTVTGPIQGTNVIASGNNSQLSSTGAGVQGVLISNTATSTNWRIEGHRTTSGALEFKNDLTNPVLNLFSSRNVGIGTFTDVASAKLIIESTTQGFLPPRMTTTQKNAIATPAAGLVVYDTTLNKLCVYTTAWETVTSL